MRDVSRRFQMLSAVGAALTLNALRPVPGTNALSVPSFFGAWLTVELAPHALAVTVAGTSLHVARRGVRSRGDAAAVALNALSAAGLVAIIRESRRSGQVIDEALTEALGADFLEDGPDLATPWRQVARPFRIAHPEVEVVRDVQYHGDGYRHRLDIYRPRDSGTGRPVLLQIHGGAWTIGRKDQQGIPLMMHLASLGWVCVAPNYRLSPKVAWPEHLIDVKRALAWTRGNIDTYGGDPSFVAATGGSAGGHLAAMLALTPNDPRYQPGFTDADTSVQACVPNYGVYDFANSLQTRQGQLRTDRLLRSIVMKRDPVVDRQIYEEASPLLLVRPDAPPFFVLHGRNDSLAPVTEARAFAEKLRANSTSPVVYAELSGTQHAFDIFHSIRSLHVVRGVERFLRHTHQEWASAR